MKRAKIKNKQQAGRAKRVRARIHGTKDCPRLSVFRSNKNFYVQLIDDEAGKTLVAASLKEAKDAKNEKSLTARVAKAFELGKIIGEKAKKAGVAKIVFDRGSYAYHGRVKALADGAREAGLKF